ncbi:MAG: hypothetical protein ACRD51_13185 [Candidatus Acidiferrum sp.]
MNALPQSVRWLWSLNILGQVSVVVVLVLKDNFRKLPFFSVYAVFNVCQSLFLILLYSLPPLATANGMTLAWDSEFITLLAQALATTEVLRITLKKYKGIWGLGWRALAIVSTLVIFLVVVATRVHGASAGWYELNRAYHLTFATAVIACLLLVRYYSIPVPTPYKMILGGFCVYSCAEILINSILQPLLKSHLSAYAPVWELTTMGSFLVAQLAWVAALWHALPAEEKHPPASSDLTYQQLSPEINEQLRLLNEKLLRLWKLEARPQ